MFLAETFNKPDDVIELQGYTVFLHNRKAYNKKCGRGSGGTAFLIKNSILNKYSIKRVKQETDCILALTITNRTTGFETLLIGVYLPPEGSVHAEDPDMLFQCLVALMYECDEANAVYLMGDYNARIGMKKDFIYSIDDIPERMVLDETYNDYGISLINVLLQTNTCIINGRVTPLRDSFTSM